MISKYVTPENVAHFSYYRQGYFWYAIRNVENGELYLFPIPVNDIAGATLNHTEKSVTLMRWVRLAITEKTLKLEPNG